MADGQLPPGHAAHISTPQLALSQPATSTATFVSPAASAQLASQQAASLCDSNTSIQGSPELPSGRQSTVSSPNAKAGQEQAVLASSVAMPDPDVDISQQLQQLKLQQQHRRQSLNTDMDALVQQPLQQQQQQQQEVPPHVAVMSVRSSQADAPKQLRQQLPNEGYVGRISGDNAAGDVKVMDGPAEWVWFRGEWGTTLAPIAQGWFHTAETPVSRTALCRVLLQAWPETLRI